MAKKEYETPGLKSSSDLVEYNRVAKAPAGSGLRVKRVVISVNPDVWEPFCAATPRGSRSATITRLLVEWLDKHEVKHGDTPFVTVQARNQE